MRDYLNIGSTPHEEPCAQVGRDDYNKLSTIECKAFAHQCHRALTAKYGEDYTVEIRVKSFPHDFGSYKEVVVYYNPDIESDFQQALYLEGEADLANWDKEALEELASLEYDLRLQAD